MIRRVRQDFQHERVDAVLQLLLTIPDSLPLGSSQFPERMQAALVLPSGENFEAFLHHVRVARVDWRGVLVAAGLAEDDWPERFGSGTPVRGSLAAQLKVLAPRSVDK